MFVEINEFADFHKNFGLRNAAETVAEKICKAMDQTNRTTQETTILNIAPITSARVIVGSAPQLFPRW